MDANCSSLNSQLRWTTSRNVGYFSVQTLSACTTIFLRNIHSTRVVNKALLRERQYKQRFDQSLLTTEEIRWCFVGLGVKAHADLQVFSNSYGIGWYYITNVNKPFFLFN